MNTTTREVGRALLLTVAIVALLLLGLLQFTWQHRRQILDAIARGILSTYAAGRWCRAELDAVADRAAVLVDAQPLPELAPITAGLAALRHQLELLIRRLYPAAA